MAICLAGWLFNETLNVPLHLEIESFIMQEKALLLKGAGVQLNLYAAILLWRAQGSDEPVSRWSPIGARHLVSIHAFVNANLIS